MVAKRSRTKLNISSIDTSNMEPLEKDQHIITLNPEAFPSKASYIDTLRKCIRAGWVKHPVKQAYKEARKKKIKNPNPYHQKRFEFVWGYTCEICGEDYVEKDIEVDHKKGNVKFTEIDEFSSYALSILHIAPEDLQILCAYRDTDVRSRKKHSCHHIKTLAEKNGISFEEARVLKKVIQVEKTGDGAVVKMLISLGVNLEDIPKTKAGKNKLLREVALSQVKTK